MSRASAVRLSCIVMTTPRIRSAGFGRAPDLLDRLEQVVGALEREVRRLDRNQQVRRRDQRVDRQQAERRRAVDDDVRVLACGAARACPSAGSARRSPRPACASSLASAMRDGAIERFGERRRQDDVRELHARVGDRVVHAARRPARMSRNDMVLLACGSRSMSSVALAAQGERRGEVDGGRGLTHAAFLIGDGNDHQLTDRAEAIVAERCAANVRSESAIATDIARPSARARRYYILYLPRSSGSRLSSHFCSRSVSAFSDVEVDRLGVVDDRLLDEDRRARPQRQRDGVARPRVDRDRARRSASR